MVKNSSSNDMVAIVPLDTGDKIPCFRQPIQITFHHYYITGPIGEPEKYLDLIHTLKTAEQHDTILIHLNSPGGMMHTAVQIMGAIKHSAANVITCMEGEVSSAATFVFLSGKKWIVNDYCTFMVHTYSHGLSGKGNEVIAHAKFFESHFFDVAKKVYAGFLSNDEVEKMIAGMDFWFNSDEVRQRLRAIDATRLINDESNSEYSDNNELSPLQEIEVTPEQLQKILNFIDNFDDFSNELQQKKQSKGKTEKS